MTLRLIATFALWITLYLLMVLVPVALMLVGPLPVGRGFWIEFGVGLGFLALAMLSVQFALIARFRWIAGRIGIDTMLHFHRQAGLFAAGLVFAHVLILLLANPDFARFFDPRVNLPRAIALSLVLLATMALIILTLLRARLRFRYEWWRLTHGLLGGLVLLIGFVHVTQVGHYVEGLWKQAVWFLVIAAALGLLIRTRLVQPALLRRRPWRISAVRRETPRICTLTLEPAGHDGMKFRAGQAVWLTVAESPFNLQQHPFTIASSSERPDRIELSIKALGDFTASIGEELKGRTAYLEGPYGAFVIDTVPPDRPLIFLAGGIGVTPFLSFLRTLRDRNESREILLFIGHARASSVPFREELAELQAAMPRLRIVHVLDEPDPSMEHVPGPPSDPLMRELIPEPLIRRGVFYLCGPEPMMDFMERHLQQRGVGMLRLRSERFTIA